MVAAGGARGAGGGRVQRTSAARHGPKVAAFTRPPRRTTPPLHNHHKLQPFILDLPFFKSRALRWLITSQLTFHARTHPATCSAALYFVIKTFCIPSIMSSYSNQYGTESIAIKSPQMTAGTYTHRTDSWNVWLILFPLLPILYNRILHTAQIQNSFNRCCVAYIITYCFVSGDVSK